MPEIQKCQLQSAKDPALSCGVTTLGDLICPHCSSIIVTPDFIFLKPDAKCCPSCHKAFVLDPDTAKIANRFHASFLLGVLK